MCTNCETWHIHVFCTINIYYTRVIFLDNTINVSVLV